MYQPAPDATIQQQHNTMTTIPTINQTLVFFGSSGTGVSMGSFIFFSF
jgi:hypothetical protein